jgi:Ca2+ transporting ATPase
MMKNIMGKEIYKINVIFELIFVGEKMMEINKGRGDEYGEKKSKKLNIIFKKFVMMKLLNEINDRKINGKRNVFEGIFKKKIFY